VAEQPPIPFAQLLRRLRSDAGLTQEELAQLAGLSPRSVSDLERGINLTARRETARLLADALGLTGSARALFEAAARGVIASADGFTGQTRPSSGLAAATRTLPRDIAAFTGRDYELAQLVRAVTGEAGSGGVVGIHAIGGMAGIGKTTFAVHAAHRLAPRFPDGQIFLPLHGHTPGQRPVDPADALASLLQTAGVAAQQVPAGLEARVRLWRDHLAGQRLLIVLDDAIGHEQVRPLLPGTAGSLVLITSRRRLTALEDAQAISLDILAADEAVELLIRLAARPGLNPGDPAVDEITQLCGYLPLAVGMLAMQLRHHPAWTAADLAADLASARDRLELMRAENLSVAAAFDLSYQDLTPDQQRLFRRLGLHPGTDFDAYAAAALDGTELSAARRHLEALYDQNLLAEPARGRYRLHDLIREHARALAATDPAAERDAALVRLLDYYLHTARAASRHFTRRTPPGVPAVAVAAPVNAPDLAQRSDAVSWMEAERLNLHAAAGYAALNGRLGYATETSAAMHGFLRSQGHWDQALTLHQAVLAAARQAGDRLAEAGALTDLGDMQRLTADFPAAAVSLTRAAELFHERGDLLGEAGALTELGVVQRYTVEYPAATASLSLALDLYRQGGDRLGQASAMTELGAAQYLTGDLRPAVTTLTQAIELCRQVGNRLVEASALDHLGVVQRATGDYLAATASHQQALELHRSLGNRNGEAIALNQLGIAKQATGDYLGALASHEQALALYRSLGNRFGEAIALNDLGVVQRATRDLAAAAVSHEQALALHRSLGNRFGEAGALNDLAVAAYLSGDYAAAKAGLGRALDLYRGLGARVGEAQVLNTLGVLSLASATSAEAIAYHEQALAIATSIALLLEQARAREGIGRSYLHAGQLDQGAAPLRQALAIYRRIGSPYAERVATTLREHDL